jgi:hypothetical protein
MDRERRLLDLCAYAGGAAQMGEVGREAIAYVDACGCQLPAQQGFANVEAGFGEELRMTFGGCYGKDASVPLQHHGELCRCASELAGYVQGIAGGCTGAAERFVFGSGAH